MPFSDYSTTDQLTRAGLVDVIIRDAEFDPSVTPPSGTITVDSLGSIEYDNASPDDEEDPQSVGMDGGSIEFTCWDTVELSDGTEKSLIDHFDNASQTEFPFAVDLILTRSSTNYEFKVEFDYEDIDYNRINRKITFNCKARNKLDDASSQDFLTYGRGKSNPDTFQGNDRFIIDDNLDGIPAGRIVSDALTEIYGLPSVRVSDRFSFLNPTDGANEFYGFITDEDSNQPDTYSYVHTHTLNDMLFSMAAIEGAYFGSAFGSSFYVARNLVDTEEHVNIDWNQTEEFEVINVRNMKLNQVREAILNDGSDQVYPQGNNGGYPTWASGYITISDSIQGFNSVNEQKEYTAAFSKYNLTTCVFNGTEETLDFTSQFTHDNMFDTLALDGRRGYAKALGASSPLRIYVKHWDVLTLKPWQTCSLINGPSWLSGRDFGIGKIEYNLETDKFEAELYEI